MVATRMRDTAFKRMLKVMPVGAAVQMEGPVGDLTLDRDVARTAVFLSGGIGITPFRSIAFQQNSNYKLIASMTGMEKSHRPWAR